MARIDFQGGESTGGSWSPLPVGDYVIQIDAEEYGVSRNKFPQLKLSGHVVDGPHDGAKVTIFQIIMDTTAWRLEQLLEASGIEYEKTDTGEVQDRKLKDGGVVEEPVFSYGFESSDLIGCQILYAVTQRTYQDKDGNDKISNDFNKPRSTKPAEPAEPAEPAAAAPAARAAAPKTATLPAKQAAPAAAPVAAAPATAARRRTAG